MPLEWLFGRKLTPDEMLRKNQRALNKVGLKVNIYSIQYPSIYRKGAILTREEGSNLFHVLILSTTYFSEGHARIRSRKDKDGATRKENNCRYQKNG